METKDRSFILYHMDIQVYKGAKVKKGITLKRELVNVLEYIMKLREVKRVINDETRHKIYYLDSFSYDKKNDIIDLVFISAKYDHVTEVINTKTLSSRGKLKTRLDGDKEKTHMSITFEDNNNALFILEDNYFGVKVKRIERYLNFMADSMYKLKDIFKGYRIFTSIVPNNEFLEELEKMSRISVARFIVDKQNINCSDFADLAERTDLRDQLELVVKPVKKGGTIKRETIKAYYEKKNNNQIIRRILVDGSEDSSSIHLDTELMKTKHNRTVEIESDTGLVKTESIFYEFHKILLGED